MATVAECELAFGQLAQRLTGADPADRKMTAFERTVSCSLHDLAVTFGARLHDGQLVDIRQVDRPDAQLRLSMTSADLLKLVAGELNLATAWASGRVKINASVFDLIKLRTMF